MKKLVFTFLVAACLIGAANAQKLNLGKAASAASNSVSAFTFTNEDAIKLSKEAVNWMDEHNEVAGPDDPYTQRLERLFGKHQSQDGLALNYKVYLVSDINAFACADGSVRVFSSLMDIMTDDELLSIIGHEIGHVKNEDTKDAMKNAYMKAAAIDAAGSASKTVQALSDSQLGELANAMLDASHSRKQESEADEYAYGFMKQHGYNVVAAYTAFKKLALLSSGDTNVSGFEKMLSSHPDSEKRAEEVKAKAEKDGLWQDPGTVELPQTRLTE
ncbi:peptidase M48 [Parapedobacter defluvii]|uniref:Peptidase M48 n=1 Tax=Parapedobacter defluvii TaxID=2045106 RepID=A0ABQ1LNZ5_9SPHI|nr:M48 family metallopeptidase [Parapedobacter defluvii]GGC26547.1 peptidase M48 [Parapedobacter defluvii]